MHQSKLPLDPNLQAARLASQRDRLEAQREREERNAKLIVLTPEERERVPVEREVKVIGRRGRRGLKMKKREVVSTAVTKAWVESGKTERDKKKPKDSSRKTNDPTISQKMHQPAGQAPNKNGGGSKNGAKKAK